MDRDSPSPSAMSAEDPSPPSSPSPDEEEKVVVKAPARKKRKSDDEKQKKVKKARKKDTGDGKKPRNKRSKDLSAAQMAVNEQMRRALEDDAYSALGSIVDTDTDDDDFDHRTKGGGSVRLDRSTILAAMRKRLWVERMSNAASDNGRSCTVMPPPEEVGEVGASTKKRKKTPAAVSRKEEPAVVAEEVDDIMERDEGSIFGQTTGASNATWVECDKCKKWRRLRGVVDEKKLPSKWYCSMNKNDPERARCSAPEEEYETPNTPESAADARTRKHLRVWVRRLEANENYEARQPTMTRGKKRSSAPSAKEPYEWIRCCNPSCGKWRALLRCMDSRGISREWYCVMNTWDEKMASCAAPQENLPAIGCPPWVTQDE